MANGCLDAEVTRQDLHASTWKLGADRPKRNTTDDVEQVGDLPPPSNRKMRAAASEGADKPARTAAQSILKYIKVPSIDPGADVASS
jgi:hypothetical protein